MQKKVHSNLARSHRRHDSLKGSSGLPQVLFLTLKRFVYDPQSGEEDKVRAAVRIDKTLRVGTVTYDFVGLIAHLGDDLRHGHYVSLARCADREYRVFDDARRPEVVTWGDVNRHYNRDAYILVFQRTATNLAAVAAPSRPALPTQWGQEADVDDESVSEDESESESEDEAPPAPAPKRAPKRRRDEAEPAGAHAVNASADNTQVGAHMVSR